VRCEVHGIAAGPDGRCALCRGSARAPVNDEGARLGLVLILGFGGASAALLGYGAWRRAEAQRAAAPLQVTAEASRPRVEVSARAADPATDTATAPEITPAPTLPPAPAASAADDSPPPSVASAVASTNPPAPSASSAKAGPSPQQVQAAVASTPIVMFTAPWCAVCRKAHAFLQANGLHCTDRDIDADPAAQRELKQRTGRTAIPTFEVDGQLLQPGFSETSVERAVAQSVERRLGVTGVAIRRSH
jgi:glutaredoxin